MFTFTLFEALGILLSVVASIVVGALWYSPLMFGPLWMTEIGLTEEKMKNMRTTPMQAMTIAVILGAVYAVLLNVLFGWIGVRTIGQGALLGGACSVSFYAVPLLIHSVFEDGSKKVWAIYASHELLLAALIGALVSWSSLS